MTLPKRLAVFIYLAVSAGAFLAPTITRRPLLAPISLASDGIDDIPTEDEAPGIIEAAMESEESMGVNGEATLEESLSDIKAIEDEKSDTDASPAIPDSTSAEPLEESLVALLQIAASTGRGEFASKSQKDKAESLISTMESQNPTSEPANSSMLNGRWELLYSSTQLFRSSPFFMAGRAVCSTPEQAKQYDWFCDMHRKALAISSIGQVRQIISPTRMVSEFEVQVGAVPFLSDFTPFKYSGGWPVTIEGAIVSSADISPNAFGDALEIYMDTVEIKGSNVPGLRQILDQGLMLGSRTLGNFLEENFDGYTNPRPVFEITYLSENLRISREQDGKVFVYGKMSDDSAPSDYSSIDADLGVAKLLEGFNDAVTKFYL